VTRVLLLFAMLALASCDDDDKPPDFGPAPDMSIMVTDDLSVVD
jgi:hypothetical protein